MDNKVKQIIESPRLFYNTKDIAEILGVSSACVRLWIKEGKLRAKKFSTVYYIPKKEMLRILKEGGYEDEI